MLMIDPDFDFIIEVEQEIAKTLRNRGDIEAADEIERRISAVRDVIED